MANNISIIGRLAADSELKHTASGSAVLEFRVADDVGFGEKKVTNWWRCSLWGKQAEGQLSDYLKKGQQVVVFGEATMREWEKDGVKHMSPEIRVSAVQLAGSKQEGGQSKQQQPSGQTDHGRAKANGYVEDKPGKFDDLASDIPFIYCDASFDGQSSVMRRMMRYG